MTETGDRMLKAAIAHFEAKRLEALASLDVYFNNAVGIGDHSDFLKEIAELTKQLSEAEECIVTLHENFGDSGDDE